MNFYYYTFAVRQGKCASAKKKKVTYFSNSR
uniref:Uncharacterized protein n=1 Tax=Anguilla anguilla TaxID=7936 RepID=A0A0E9W643_ANGAN